MLSEHMPQALGPFLRDNPDIFVSVSDKPSHEVVNLLKDGEADIGVVAASADMSGLERWRFVPDRLVLIVPTDCPIKEPVPFSTILNHPIIALQEKVALTQFLKRLSNELGRRPNIRFRCENFEALADIVSCGAGIGIVPQTAAERYTRGPKGRVLTISDHWAERELYLCVRSRAQLPAYAGKLLDHLLIYAQAHSRDQNSPIP
jgi:DNA-binding transcriptional LysR family regulator